MWGLLAGWCPGAGDEPAAGRQAGCRTVQPAWPAGWPAYPHIPAPLPPPLPACRYKASLAACEGVTLGHFREGRQSFMGAFNQLLAGAASAVNPAEAGRVDPVEAAARAGIFIALNASTVELADLGGWVGGLGGWVGMVALLMCLVAVQVLLPCSPASPASLLPCESCFPARETSGRRVGYSWALAHRCTCSRPAPPPLALVCSPCCRDVCEREGEGAGGGCLEHGAGHAALRPG